MASPASALSLGVSLPLGQLLQPVLQPVTELVNPVTQSLPLVPITVTPSNRPVDVNITTPTPSSLPQPTPTTTPDVTTQPTNSKPTTTVSPRSAASNAQNNNQSPVDAAASFFTSTIPNALSSVATFIAGKRVNPLPVAISAGIFAATLVVIGMIIYASRHAGTLKIGRFTLARLVEAHDVTQMATLVIVTICFGFVAVYLSLTIL